ncbi:hypothetical protein M422DRAFT_266961 [Sphaerobolus stellatus SS14]|uniref:Uncharacterized protein n=1 Tax=Sphaerobolus stellatus (strain SS14) TaxID=990650 RepID=A0A0C9UQS6_SPHS4|nr:hypothetical protein M422DRAFT_266961 [Sphaerobolus stellatus SS14]
MLMGRLHDRLRRSQHTLFYPSRPKAISQWKYGSLPFADFKSDASRDGVQKECKALRRDRRLASPTRFHVAPIGICASGVESMYYDTPVHRTGMT